MAYDEDLADRIRVAIGHTDVSGLITEKRMFGGLAFLLDGNMSVAASGQGGLMVRVDPDETETLVAEPHASPFEMRGRGMAGWIRVDDAGVATEEALEKWIAIGLARAGALPAK